MSSSSARFLHFEVSGTNCALPISHVREVLPMATLTRTPQLPSFVEGFLNIGGTAIAVVRLAQLLGLPLSELAATSHLIWIRDEVKPLILLVDRVHSVFSALPDETFALQAHQTFNGCVVAQLKLEQKQVHLLSLEHLMLAQERKTTTEFALLSQKRVLESAGVSDLGDGKKSA